MGSGAGLIVTHEKPAPPNWLVTVEYANPDAACFTQVFKNIVPDETPPDPLYLRKPDARPQIIGQINS